jgi:hypothetical protein
MTALFGLEDIESKLADENFSGFTCYRHTTFDWMISVKTPESGLETRFRNGRLEEALVSGILDSRQVIPEEITIANEEDELIEDLI